MLEFLLRVVGFGVAVGAGLWLVFFVWDSIKNYGLSSEPPSGLANDGDDWAPWPQPPSRTIRVATHRKPCCEPETDPYEGVGECFDCGGPISPEKGCPPCGLPPLVSSQSRPDIEQQVCQDILERQKLGIAKYGTTVAENPLSLREWLQHSYEEKLDDLIYMKRAIVAINEEAGK